MQNLTYIYQYPLLILNILTMSFICTFSISLYAQDASCISTSTLTVSINDPCDGLVQIKAYLEGAYNSTTNEMSVSSSFQTNIPMQQPYNRTPWNYTGTETIVNTSPMIIDWVLVELLDGNTQSSIDRKAALLLKDGRIVAPQWVNDNTIDGVYCNIATNNSYYILIRHRNHLAVASATPVTLPNNTAYDFTIESNIMGGINQLTWVNSNTYALSVGDYDSNGIITVNDFNGYLTETSTINSYIDSDFNFDYNNTVSDFNAYVPNASKIGITLIRY